MPSLRLPTIDGDLVTHDVGEPGSYTRPTAPLESRRAFAAAHVVADPLADNTPGTPAAVDWEATMAFRRHLWSWGLPVAEAMDTAQRGMGLDWAATKELITRSLAEAKAEGGDIACGANTDQIEGPEATFDEILAAYREQIELIEEHGGQAVVMASRHLARAARGPDDYGKLYGQILEGVDRPVIIHWLGEMFDPALAGYWGAADLDESSELFVDILAANAGAIDGVKISLLDRERELYLRSRLPDGLRMYTGDDFNFPGLIKGDDDGYSDAFLGAFDLIAPAASAAVQALDRGDGDAFETILEPTVELSRHVFGAPTFYYKTGVVFMAYLNGHQEHFRMVNGLESARSVTHLSHQFVLADRAGLLDDPERATDRMAAYLRLAGIDQD